MKYFLIFSECWTDRLDYCLDEEDKLAVFNTQNFLWTDANTWTPIYYQLGFVLDNFFMRIPSSIVKN